MNNNKEIVYLPFYSKVRSITSKFYAQFHNKSLLGEILTKLIDYPHKNVLLDIFIKNVDHQNAN